MIDIHCGIKYASRSLNRERRSRVCKLSVNAVGTSATRAFSVTSWTHYWAVTAVISLLHDGLV